MVSAAQLPKDRRRRILVAGHDTHFRERVLNFLLSEGFEFVESSESVLEEIESLKSGSYDVVVLEARTGHKALETARFLRGTIPSLRIILVIDPEDQEKWSPAAAREFPFLLKSSLSSDLLYLLDG